MVIEGGVLATIGAIYFLPSIIAGMKKRKNSVDILILNTFLGWTILGWIIALIWALLGKSALPIKPEKGKNIIEKRISLVTKWFGLNKK